MAHKMDIRGSDGGQHGKHVIHERLQGEVPGAAHDGGRARVPGVVGDHVVASGQITDGRKEDLMIVRIAGVAVHHPLQALHAAARGRRGSMARPR